MYVLSLGAGGQADGLHLCFHMIKPHLGALEVAWSVFLPGHYHWLARVGCAFLLWLSMGLIHLSP